jgi:hypothetical protein
MGRVNCSLNRKWRLLGSFLTLHSAITNYPSVSHQADTEGPEGVV